MSITQKLNTAINSFAGDYEKAQNGNRSAATRARKALSDIKKIAHEGRVEILELRKDGDDNA